MTKLEEVRNRLYEKDASLVVLYEDGKVKEYYQDRIKDIKNILKEDPLSLQGATIADKVIGKTAACILAHAGVKEIFSNVISKYAIPVLEGNDIRYEYKVLADYIQNNDKTGMCPMENKYKDETDISKVYNEMIGEN